MAAFQVLLNGTNGTKSLNAPNMPIRALVLTCPHDILYVQITKLILSDLLVCFLRKSLMSKDLVTTAKRPLDLLFQFVISIL